MDIWHRLGRIFRLSNLGTLIFFMLNVGLIILMFYPWSVTLPGVLMLVGLYAVTLLISLSPVGEWLLGVFAGAREIKRTDFKLKLLPLVDVVHEQAMALTPDIVKKIRIKMVPDEGINAYVIGRRTLCVTQDFMNLTDDEAMAILAHEMGHLAYRHSVVQLLIGGGNVFITGFLLTIKAVSWMITGIFTLIGISSGRLGRGILLTLVGGISTLMVFLWTKFCMLFLMWSSRRNEFTADEYAYNLGYGTMLASVLDRAIAERPTQGLLKALYASHPSNDDRVAHLQELGANYSRY